MAVPGDAVQQPAQPTPHQPLDWSVVSKTGETRPQHVALHGQQNLTKPQHNVFYGDPVDTVNKAWDVGQTLQISPHHIGGTDLYVIPYPNAGWAGGYKGQGQNLNIVTIVTIHGTNQIIMGFPGNGLPLPSP